ncbi:MAG: FliM/FliN family flagellar motor C-terminal domain-containing protein [Roseobacter sp.]
MSVLQRKAQAGKQEHQARAMSVPKALRLSLAKVADDLLDLPMTVIGIVPEQRSGDNLAETFDDTSMLILLDGPYRVSAGISFGHKFVSALVQQQTMGKILSIPEEPRHMTATDASLCAPLIEALTDKVHAILETDEDRVLVSKYRFGARCDTPRLFDLALTAQDYQIYKLTVEVSGGAFQSGVTLYLPIVEKKHEILKDPDGGASQKPKKPGMYKTAMSLNAELTAVLSRERRSLFKLSQLKPGDTFPISPGAFDNIELLDGSGQKVCVGALGQVDGMRALKLHSLSEDGQKRAKAGDSFALAEQKGAEPDYDGLGDFPNLDLPASLPDLEMEADLPELPDLGDLPDMIENGGALPDLPDLPALDSDAVGDLPDLPDLPDLDDLPDLPDLDDLPKLNSA